MPQTISYHDELTASCVVLETDMFQAKHGFYKLRPLSHIQVQSIQMFCVVELFSPYQYGKLNKMPTLFSLSLSLF